MKAYGMHIPTQWNHMACKGNLHVVTMSFAVEDCNMNPWRGDATIRWTRLLGGGCHGFHMSLPCATCLILKHSMIPWGPCIVVSIRPLRYLLWLLYCTFIQTVGHILQIVKAIEESPGESITALFLALLPHAYA